MKSATKSAAFCLILTVAACAWADVVHMKDGTRLEGDVKKGPAGYTIVLPGGKVQVVPADQVKSIELAAGAVPVGGVAVSEKLASLRRAVEYLDDPKKIIDRYQRFIEQVAGTSVEADARKDLALWQDRLDKGLVKFGTRWVTPAERTQLQEKALQQADVARKLLKAGKFAEAESAINQVLSDDPQNVTALYLRGLMQYRQEQFAAARKSFETVNTLLPNNAPTLNNLAVVQWRQNQVPAAMITMDLAMNASARNRDILDNVAELLWSVPEEQRATAVGQRVLRKFGEQDVALGKELEKKALHRWGATWVTTDQLLQLKDAERQAKDKLDALSAEFDAVKVRITNIDRDIETNERSMRQLEATSYVRDVNGNIYQTALPPLYGELQIDNRKLQGERQEQFARLDRLREQAKRVNQDLPIPKYAGAMKVIDENGAPVIAPAMTTKSTTSPAADQPPLKEPVSKEPAAVQSPAETAH